MATKESLRILLVEDNDDHVFLFERAIRETDGNHELIVAHDGLEAIEQLERLRNEEEKSMPDLILLDINMPRMDGFETLEKIREFEEYRMIPVLMLTSSANDEDVARSYASGACSYVTKPDSYREFATMVKELSRYWTTVSRAV